MLRRFVRLLLATTVYLSAAPFTHAADLMSFWETPQYGGNSFNRLPPTKPYFDALHAYGATWVRLAYDKWQGQQHDFLIGNAGDYRGLQPTDLATLKATLDRAQAAGLKVVIAPLSLPGARWRQNNRGQLDDRLWHDPKYAQQAAAFWRDLARELKDHPAVAAYNLLNEPVPEQNGGLAGHADIAAQQAWYQQQRGGPRDLPAFYNAVIKAIREVDPLTPIMVDSGWYGAADMFSYWPGALADSRVLYSFHMYEPYEATSPDNLTRQPQYTYPGDVPVAGKTLHWDAQQVARWMQVPLDWAKARNIPPQRMVAGEFGCMRMWSGCAAYLQDVLSALDQAKIHWAFYSFREDVWDGMDYELGHFKVPDVYWTAIKLNAPDPVIRRSNSMFEPIHQRLQHFTASATAAAKQ